MFGVLAAAITTSEIIATLEAVRNPKSPSKDLDVELLGDTRTMMRCTIAGLPFYTIQTIIIEGKGQNSPCSIYMKGVIVQKSKADLAVGSLSIMYLLYDK
jgi:hypothetical protein